MGHEEIVNYLLGQDVEVNGKDNVCAMIIYIAKAFKFLCIHADNTTDTGI